MSRRSFFFKNNTERLPRTISAYYQNLIVLPSEKVYDKKVTGGNHERLDADFTKAHHARSVRALSADAAPYVFGWLLSSGHKSRARIVDLFSGLSFRPWRVLYDCL